jgi:hypothetical protein
MENKIAILTKAELFKEEQFIDVFTSVKIAESWTRKNISQYLKKDGIDSYSVTSNGKTTLYFIRLHEIKSK